MEVLDCSRNIYLMESPGFFSAVLSPPPSLNLYDSFESAQHEKTFLLFAVAGLILIAKNKERVESKSFSWRKNCRGAIKWNFLPIIFLLGPEKSSLASLSRARREGRGMGNYTTSNAFRHSFISLRWLLLNLVSMFLPGMKWKIIYGWYHCWEWYITCERIARHFRVN